jgi:hypothetical protein
MGRHIAAIGALAVLAAVAAFAAVAATGDSEGTPAAAAFRLEDGSAGCNYRASGELACRAAGDESAVVLEPSGESRVEADAIVAWDESTPVLLASESWWNGSVACRVSPPRIVCAAGDGAISAGGE